MLHYSHSEQYFPNKHLVALTTHLAARSAAQKFLDSEFAFGRYVSSTSNGKIVVHSVVLLTGDLTA